MKKLWLYLIIIFPTICFGDSVKLLNSFDIFLLDSGKIIDSKTKVGKAYLKSKDGYFFDLNEIWNAELTKNGFTSVIKKDGYRILMFNKKGEEVNEISYGDFTVGRFSYSENLFYRRYSENLYVSDLYKQNYKIEVEKGYDYQNRIFMKSKKVLIFQKDDENIYIFNLDTKEKRLIAKINFPIEFGDVSYDNKLLLITDRSRILTLNLLTGNIQVIKKYEPTIFSYYIREYNKKPYPNIVQPSFSWREDGKGFIFSRYPESENFLWLGFSGKINPPALYYYDLEENKEYLITEQGTRGKIAIRKKLGSKDSE